MGFPAGEEKRKIPIRFQDGMLCTQLIIKRLGIAINPNTCEFRPERPDSTMQAAPTDD
jgi:hypothetical protein